MPLVIAHRGASAEAPENTFPAFDLALRQRADGIELDVRLSLDGVPVVIHDATLDRTTSGTKRVERHTVGELRRLDAGSWFNRRYPEYARWRYRQARIPLLADLMAWVKRRRCVAFVEIKRARRGSAGMEAKVLDTIYRTGVENQITIISFDLATLRRLRQLDSKIALGLDSTRTLLLIRRSQSVGATTVLPHGAFASQRFIARARRAGLRVVPWGLETASAMRRKLAEGVDGLITSHPARLRRLL